MQRGVGVVVSAAERVIGVVTVGRSDYGICRPLLKQIAEAPGLDLRVVVGGAHLSSEFGMTVREIEADGFPIEQRVEMPIPSDAPEGTVTSMSYGLARFGDLFARFLPDILVVLGDRFEMCAAALAALHFRIPVAHVHGGELTRGATDDAMRHCMTKLSHLHFVSTEAYARRVRQLGEDPQRVFVTGALSMDAIRCAPKVTLPQFRDKYGLQQLDLPFLLVTYHPVTLEYDRTDWQIGELLAALEDFDVPVLFTMPNADAGGKIVRRRIEAFVNSHDSAHAVESLGPEGYPGAMSLAAAMVGNSSSGIVEALAFRLPVVNVGTRQQGRVRGANVIDVGYERQAVSAGVRKALSDEFRSSLTDMDNPYGDGHAAERIVRVLGTIDLDTDVVKKRFHDVV